MGYIWGIWNLGVSPLAWDIMTINDPYIYIPYIPLAMGKMIKHDAVNHDLINKYKSLLNHVIWGHTTGSLSRQPGYVSFCYRAVFTRKGKARM